MRLRELTGQMFGRLHVLERGPNAGKHVKWVCRCACGHMSVVSSTHLVSGHTTSCGCVSSEWTREMGRANLDYGHARTGHESPEYRTWCGMLKRCYYPKGDNYRLYGGRGIRVCQEWLDSFFAFLRDVGQKPFPSASIDRIDANGHYEPGNVRWASASEQAKNRRPKIKPVCGAWLRGI